MEFERAINYYELDGMNVVHHSNYIRYMEEARVYWLERIGLPYQKIEEDGIMTTWAWTSWQKTCWCGRGTA